MITFLPYKDFEKSAQVLDFRRLGKQRVEGKGIIEILEGKPSRWVNHPVVRIWHGYTNALKYYTNCMIIEWVCRGYINNLPLYKVDIITIEYPEWLGDERLHQSHRSMLLQKKPEYYSQYWNEPIMKYYWPR